MPKTRPTSHALSKPSQADGLASPIEGFITFRVSRLKKLMDRYSSRALADRFDMALAEWRVLTILYFASPASAKWLCVKLQADKAEISRACTVLVQRGLASRQGNRKIAHFSITPNGFSLHDQVMPSRQEIQAELALTLSPAELKGLYAAFQKLTDYLTARLTHDDATCPRQRYEKATGKAGDVTRVRAPALASNAAKRTTRADDKAQGDGKT